jgi:hypothetical protein
MMKTLDVAELGVIETLNPTSTNVALLVEAFEVFVPCTTCNTFPPPAGADQAGTPPTTVNTLPVDPIPSLVFVLAVDERYSISPRVVEGFKFLVVVSTEVPSDLIADAPSLTKAVSSGVVQP